MRNRWAKVVFVSLAMGIAINVALAWGVMLRHGVPTSQPRRSHVEDRELAWLTSVPADWPAAANSWSRIEWWNCTIDDQMVVPDKSPGDPVSRHVFGGHWVRVVSWGWPRASLAVVWMREEPITMDAEGMPHRQQGIRGGLPLPAQFERRPWAARLPIAPMWPGFAVSTLLYGVIFGAVLFGPGAVRRMLRNRRGACIGCGYDLAGLGQCPECGKQAETRGLAGQDA